MYVTLSDSHDIVLDLGELLKSGKTPKVYYTLFEWSNDVTVLNEALGLFDMTAEGCLFEEALLHLRLASLRDQIRRFSKQCKGSILNYAQLRALSETEEIVLVTKISDKHFKTLTDALEREKIRCRLYEYNDIRNSSVVNGEVRVINRVGYLNSWPWFMDILYKDMPVELRKGLKNTNVTGTVNSNGKFYCYKDFSSEYAQFKDGYRRVPGYTPVEGMQKYTVTLLGDSRFAHTHAPEDMTVAAYLQTALNEKKLHCEVKNISVCANKMQNQFAMLKSMELGASDVIICTDCAVGQYYDDLKKIPLQTLARVKVRMMHDMTEYCHARGAEIYFLHLPAIMDIPNPTPIEQFVARSYGLTYKPDTMHETIKQYAAACGVRMLDFTDVLINTERTAFLMDESHLSPEGSQFTAAMLSGYISSWITQKELLFSEEVDALMERVYAAHDKYAMESRFKGLNEYLDGLRKLSADKPENCGAIVMNCNPFTLGHRYLIETASKKVKHLFVLAVEEDRSVFKFADRIEMMRRGTADLKNVSIIPSGKFVVSSLTFPEYFEKSKKPDVTVDTTMDLEIFGEYIAPALHVKTRFVGEEPIDMVTNQYNRSMEKNLPKYGITLVEIPRKKSGKAVISASRVRKLLDEKDYAGVKAIVPKTTYDYLINVLGY